MTKRTAHLLLSTLLIVVGAVLAAGKIVYDSEPGLIPLVLLAAGVAWHIVARRRFPSDNNRPH